MNNAYNLLKSYLSFCKIKEKAKTNNHIDLSGEKWLYPTELLPIAVLLTETPTTKVSLPKDIEVSGYFKYITEGYRYHSPSKTTLPMLRVPISEIERDKMTDRLLEIENGDLVGGRNAFGYVISELISNVYQHSEFSVAYIMAQKYNHLRLLELCVVDNGISIPESLRKAGYNFNTDEKAIGEAVIHGASSKKSQEGRGHGFRSIVKLLVEGLGGYGIIVSGNGAIGLDYPKKTLYRLPS
ncbi:hypothetical protein BMS3Bbin15_01180 [archaeon BMS3Bbin15]|nr:hypothetical protein BMS3Bbin15_01180 [archaeon BMS3Bbin15]